MVYFGEAVSARWKRQSFVHLFSLLLLCLFCFYAIKTLADTSVKVPDQGWTGRAFTLSLSLQAGMLTALHQEFGEKSIFSDSPVSWIHQGLSWVFSSL